MAKTGKKRGYRRGYPIALLVGLEADHAALWEVFSNVVKPRSRLELNGNRTEAKSLYNFHESIVDTFRPLLKEGVRSIIVVAPTRTSYGTDLLNHVRKHHAYLIRSDVLSSVAFVELVGSADNIKGVHELVKTTEFKKAIAEAPSEGAASIVNEFEKSLNVACDHSAILFSLDEIEDAVRRGLTGDYDRKYLLVTDSYLKRSRDKSRLNTLLQISRNKHVETRIVNSDSQAGKRISQLGGLVFLARSSLNRKSSAAD